MLRFIHSRITRSRTARHLIPSLGSLESRISLSDLSITNGGSISFSYIYGVGYQLGSAGFGGGTTVGIGVLADSPVVTLATIGTTP